MASNPIFEWRWGHISDVMTFRPTVLYEAFLPEPISLDNPKPAKDLDEVIARQLAARSRIPKQSPLMVPLAYGRRLTDDEIRHAPRQISFRASKPAVKNAGLSRHALRVGTVPLVSELLCGLLDQWAPGSFQFLPIEPVDFADGTPLWPDRRFFIVHCVNNLLPIDLWDPAELEIRPMEEPRGGFDSFYVMVRPSRARTKQNFSTDLRIFHSLEFSHYSASQSDRIFRGLVGHTWLCTHDFVAAVLKHAPKVAHGSRSCDYNHFHDVGPLSANQNRLAGLEAPFAPNN